MKVLLVLLLLVAGSLAAPVSFRVNSTLLTFSDDQSSGLSLTGLQSLKTGTQFLSASATTSGLFSLDLVTATGPVTVTQASPCSSRAVSQGEDGVVTASFIGLLAGCLDVNVTAFSASSLPFPVPVTAVRWAYSGSFSSSCAGSVSPRAFSLTFAANLRAAKRVRRPSRAEPQGKVFLPHGFGASAPVELVAGQADSVLKYPGEATMQLLGYSIEDEGLMLATLCGGGSNKIYTVGAGLGDARAVRIELQVPVFNGGLTMSGFSNPFPILSAPYEGTDWDMALIYRGFAHRWASWVTQPVRNRTDVPAWLLETHLWVNSGWQQLDVFNVTQGDPAVVQARMTGLAKVFRDTASTALHWYVWDDIRAFDASYPDYLPAKPGFEEAVSDLQGQFSYKIVPYINGRLWDTATASWNQSHAELYAAKQAKDQVQNPGQSIYVEQYGSGANLAVMCPATPMWQNTIASVVEAIYELGVDGVYVDQVSAAYPAPCYDTTHGHTVGGGNYWSHGYWAMLKAARSAAKSLDFGLVSEANAETYMASLGGYLTLTAFAALPEGVSRSSVFQVVYGGYYNAFGAEFMQTDLTEADGAAFDDKLATMFVEGAQLGWFSLGGTTHQPMFGMYDLFVSGKYPRNTEFVNTLVAYRKLPAVSAHLRDGVLLRPLRGGGGPRRVASSVWAAPAGSPYLLALFFVNAAAEPAFLDTDISLAAYAKDALSLGVGGVADRAAGKGASFTVTRVTPTGPNGKQVTTEDLFNPKVVVGGRDVAIFVVATA